METRICSHCGSTMSQGYVIENGIEYYCSKGCLHENISESEWEELYADGEGDSYWTSWN